MCVCVYQGVTMYTHHRSMRMKILALVIFACWYDKTHANQTTIVRVLVIQIYDERA